VQIKNLLWCLVATLLWAASPVLAEIVNPQPAANDLVLPMPDDGGMVFRPVFVGTGNTPFTQKKFKMGDPNGGFREFPTAVSIGGAFVADRDGQSGWLYYIGKCEVTESQYYALMDLPEGASQELKGSKFPITGVSFLQSSEFAHRYNMWLYQNAVEKLPKVDDSPAYVRLPTEVEWEFAARGGIAVNSDDFDRKVPYPGSLAVYEWFSGPSSSHNKVQEVGLLQPNPLGIHDMLGNVSEMTSSLYQIEYYQGRSGGFTARGGHFLTAEKELRSSLRTEQPFYLYDPSKRTVQVNAKPTMGFRLALSSPVYTSRQAAQELAAAWEDYRSAQGAGLPAAISVSPVSTQTDAQREEAFVYLERLKRALSAAGQPADTVAQELGLLEASLDDIRFIRKQAEQDSAYAWVKIATEQGFFLYRELRKLPTLDELLNVARKTGRTPMAEKLQERHDEINANIEQSLSTYSDSLRQLITLDTTAVDAGFDQYVQFLLQHKVAEQMQALKIVQSHYTTFTKDQRAAPGKWRDDFSTLGK